jgi:hypothetical protein
MRGADLPCYPERTLQTPQDYRAAAARIAPYTRRTPVLRATVDNRPVSFKLEHLQVAGVFKIRGALNALLVQGDDPPEPPAYGGPARPPIPPAPHTPLGRTPQKPRRPPNLWPRPSPGPPGAPGAVG